VGRRLNPAATSKAATEFHEGLDLLLAGLAADE
jgi:hypothetical protein